MSLNYNYDLSIIIPFYKKKKEFKLVLPLNYKYFIQNGVEIILVVDEPLSLKDFKFMERYDQLKYKIIVNKQVHGWRNPAKVINVGLRHCSKKFVLIMSPESIMWGNIIKLFHKSYQPKSYLTGVVGFILKDQYLKKKKEDPGYLKKEIRVYNYGSIYLKKSDLIKVGGYNENFNVWGGEDCEVRLRLQQFKYTPIQISSARLIHIDLKPRNLMDKIKGRDRNAEQLKHLEHLQSVDFKNNGRDFNHILIDRTSQSATN